MLVTQTFTNSLTDYYITEKQANSWAEKNTKYQLNISRIISARPEKHTVYNNSNSTVICAIISIKTKQCYV